MSLRAAGQEPGHLVNLPVSRYGIFHIAGGMIDVEKIGERGNTYENFMTDLLKKDGDKDDCRFASKSVRSSTFVWISTISSYSFRLRVQVCPPGS